jgi:mannose-1-phosphate guanylyltransferase
VAPHIERASALIIAGGRGTRFWPASREQRPKPLFSIGGGSTLLGGAIARLSPLIAPERIFVLVTAAQQQAFKRAVRGLIPPRNLLLEPEGRGTSVAIAYGSAIIRRRLGEGLIAVMPADHYISTAGAFRRTLARALNLAWAKGAIVVIGVKPTRPETGYGYQEMGAKAGSGYRVVRFVEKPSLADARRMVRSGRFLWNAGMFVMTAATLQAELTAHCPALARAAEKLAVMRPWALARAYRALGFDSFDRDVVEKSAKVLGVHADFRWHDVGTWEGLWEAMGGRMGNVLVGQVLALDSDGVLAHSNSRLMVLLGVKDIVAIDADDALLIIHRARSQETRRVTEELRRRGLGRYL